MQKLVYHFRYVVYDYFSQIYLPRNCLYIDKVINVSYRERKYCIYDRDLLYKGEINYERRQNKNIR